VTDTKVNGALRKPGGLGETDQLEGATITGGQADYGELGSTDLGGSAQVQEHDSGRNTGNSDRCQVREGGRTPAAPSRKRSGKGHQTQK